MKSLANLIIAGVMFGVAFHLIHTDSSSTAATSTTTTKPSAPAYAQPALTKGTYGMAYMDQMLKAGTDNQMEFDRYYKGHTFDAVLPFNETGGQVFSGGYYAVFGRRFLTHGVQCMNVSMNGLADWKSGDMARITGIIDDTVFQNLVLQNCRITNATPTTKG